MKRVAILLLVLFTQAATADEIVDIEGKVTELDKQSTALLGVSLNALRFLVAAREDAWVSLSKLKESGDFGVVEELERAGYVKVTERDGLPNGYDRGNVYVSVTPRMLGREIQASVLALRNGPLAGVAWPDGR